MVREFFQLGLLLLYAAVYITGEAVINTHGNTMPDVAIECNSNNIKVTVSTGGEDFHGMVYPKGLSTNSMCLVEYENAGSQINYTLPLRSCNTMSHETAEGVEFYNTIVIQPHSKLVTAFGRGFHVRCRYQKENHTIKSASGVHTIETSAKELLPNCAMKIYKGRPDEHVIAEHAKIGDYLTLVVSIEEQQDIFGIKVTNCIAKDGVAFSEEPLIDNDGCPINEDVLSELQYSKNLTMAHVVYPAHKFPYVSTIYYQCNVKLCLKKGGGCADVPPVCDETGQNILRRRKRQSEVEDNGSLKELLLNSEDLRDHSVEVYSGLYVNEVDELEDENDFPVTLPAQSDDFCLSTRKFAIGIAIAGVLLMLAVILLVACIVRRRHRRKGTSTTGSSIYSGPYSNQAYSRD